MVCSAAPVWRASAATPTTVNVVAAAIAIGASTAARRQSESRVASQPENPVAEVLHSLFHPCVHLAVRHRQRASGSQCRTGPGQAFRPQSYSQCCEGEKEWGWQAKAPAPPRAGRVHALVGQPSACKRPLADAFFLTF